MKSEQKIIFSNSYSPRTGHNFVAQVLKIFTNLEVLIHDKSETKLTTLLESYYAIYNAHIFFQPDKSFFDFLFIDDIRYKILSKSNADYVVIKDTSFVGVNHLKHLFPNDIHILVIRDPRDVFFSLFKGMQLKKPTIKNYIKRMTLPVGLYPYFYSRKISRKIIKSIPNFDDFVVVRYENLVLQNNTELLQLKQLFQCNLTLEEIKQQINQIPVVNTSFIEETKGKHIWDAKPKTASFNPVKRKFSNKLIEWGILLGSRELRSKLKYI